MLVDPRGAGSDEGMGILVSLPSPEPSNELVPSQADNDDQWIELWLHGRPATTQRAYRADITKLRRHAEKSLQHARPNDSSGNYLPAIG